MKGEPVRGLVGGLSCNKADIEILGAERRILNADGNFLGAYNRFLFAAVSY